MKSNRPKLLLFVAAIPFSLFSTSPVVDADAACLNETPPVFVMTDLDYYNNYDDENDIVMISGTVRNDVLMENEFDNEILIQIYDPANAMIKSDSAHLNINNGSFFYNFPLWKNSDSESTAYDVYTVKATYGSYSANWTFALTRGVPGIIAMEVTSLTVRDAGGRDISHNEISTGQQVQFSATLKNYDRRFDRPFVTILEVRDSDGVSVYIGLQSGFLNPECDTDMGFSWIGEKEGHYEARTFTITDLENPQVLSSVRQTEVHVTNESYVGEDT